jgi:hypothetical protein
MGHHIDGAKSDNESSIAIVAFAKCVEMKVIRLITSFLVCKVAQMMTIICSYCADHAIRAKGGGFLVHQGHP